MEDRQSGPIRGREQGKARGYTRHVHIRLRPELYELVDASAEVRETSVNIEINRLIEIGLKQEGTWHSGGGG